MVSLELWMQIKMIKICSAQVKISKLLSFICFCSFACYVGLLRVQPTALSVMLLISELVNNEKYVIFVVKYQYFKT